MFIGLAAGFFGGLIDEVFMRLTDIFLAFPEVIAAMALAGIMGPGNTNLVFAISCVAWTKFARMARGITLTSREMLYVKAARLSQVSSFTIIIRHIVPTILPSMTVLATSGITKGIIGGFGSRFFGIRRPTAQSRMGGITDGRQGLYLHSTPSFNIPGPLYHGFRDGF